jgi:hypothetical protein
VLWCRVVQSGSQRCRAAHHKKKQLMPTKKKQPIEAAPPAKAPRQSVTFAPEIYAELERLSKQKKVSIAWVVREATEEYVANQNSRLAIRRNGSAM